MCVWFEHLAALVTRLRVANIKQKIKGQPGPALLLPNVLVPLKQGAGCCSPPCLVIYPATLTHHHIISTEPPPCPLGWCFPGRTGCSGTWHGGRSQGPGLGQRRPTPALGSLGTPPVSAQPRLRTAFHCRTGESSGRAPGMGKRQEIHIWVVQFAGRHSESCDQDGGSGPPQRSAGIAAGRTSLAFLLRVTSRVRPSQATEWSQGAPSPQQGWVGRGGRW